MRVAGVPPDYFSATGQRWGNPLYRWDVLEARGFDWWIDRIRRAVELYDIVRLDHFRGFEAYWAIPAKEETAVNGEWVKAPGLELFRALEAALGPLPLVAEDLGMITPEVDALRLELGMPGMKVLQFGFSNKGAHTHLPHRFTPATVAYTGTHDNDTTQGWWNTAGKTEQRRRRSARRPGRQSPRLAADPRRAGQRCRNGDRSRAGLARAGFRGAHEYAGRACGQLELARAGRLLDGGTGGAAGRACRGHGPGQRSAGDSRRGSGKQGIAIPCFLPSKRNIVVGDFSRLREVVLAGGRALVLVTPHSMRLSTGWTRRHRRGLRAATGR